MAQELGISLGSINFCFQALVEKGWIKTQNFSQHRNKPRYANLLTSAGVAEKSKLTAEFLRWKAGKYGALQQKINRLKKDTSTAQLLLTRTGAMVYPTQVLVRLPARLQHC